MRHARYAMREARCAIRHARCAMRDARCPVAMSLRVPRPPATPRRMQKILELSTALGPCRCSLFHPEGTGAWPAVLFFMDGIGYRPPLFIMAERLATAGYVVALPDMFFRAGAYDHE